MIFNDLTPFLFRKPSKITFFLYSAEFIFDISFSGQFFDDGVTLADCNIYKHEHK